MPFYLDLKMEEGIKKVIITDLVLIIAGKSKEASFPKMTFIGNLKKYAPYINELVEGRIVSYFLDEEELKLIDGTLLHIAVLFGNAWAVDWILTDDIYTSEKIDISIETEEGETALDIAKRKYNELQKEDWCPHMTKGFQQGSDKSPLKTITTIQ